MLFELPIVYKVTGVKRGNRRATTYNVVEMIEVDIPIVAEADAPIAVEWNARIQGALTMKSGLGYLTPGFPPTPPDGLLHTRLINERHFVPVVGVDIAGGIAPLVDPELLQEMRGVGVWRDIFNLKELPNESFNGIENLGKKGLVPVTSLDATFETVERTGRDKAIAALRQSVGNCAFVGNTLYRVCSEPKAIFAEVQVKDDRGVWQKGYMTFVSSDPDHVAQYFVTSGSGYNICELTSWKSLVRKCKRLNERFRDLFDPLYADNAPVVNDIIETPEYRLTKDVEQSLEKFMAQGRVFRLGEISTVLTRAYCVVVDAAALIREPGGLDDLEGALANFIETASIDNYKEHLMANCAAAVQEVIASRPVDIGVRIQRVGS
jgi:hypothetical protein